MTEPEGGNGDPKAPKKRRLRPLPGLDVEELRHPHDARATEALKKIPGLDKVLAKILEYGLERLYYVDNVASNLRVTPKMFGRLHRSLTWACKILDVPEPELYVTVEPAPNAFTYGHTKPFITLTSGLIDMLGDEELFYVIGHEVGHIKAGHVLYGTMARNIAAVVALLRVVPLRRAHGGSRGAPVRAGHGAGPHDADEARGRHDPARGRDGSRRVPAPGARVRGRRSIVARQGVQGAADAVADTSVRHATRQGARALVQRGIFVADGAAYVD